MPVSNLLTLITNGLAAYEGLKVVCNIQKG